MIYNAKLCQECEKVSRDQVIPEKEKVVAIRSESGAHCHPHS